MPAVPLAALAQLAGAAYPVDSEPDNSHPDDNHPKDGARLAVGGVSLDSRAVRTGDLYAALPGARAHGADFVPAALAAGAVAVLTDPAGAARIGELRAGPDAVPVLVVADPRAVLGELAATVYGHPADELRMVGITGTNGKTTTAYLVDSALRALGLSTGLIGTVETRIGQQRIASVRTTPEAVDLHAILAVMRERGAAAAVMEVSSHALAQHRVDGVVYDVVLFTNLSQDHLDFHPSMADYFAAKASLFTPARARLGVVCVDDEWGARLAATSGIDVWTVSSGPTPARWRVSTDSWPALRLRGPDGQLTLHCHLPGTFNVVNTAMAALVLLRLGYAAADVEQAMATEPLVPGRMQVVPGEPGDPRCVVDYAHTPEAVDAALAALRPSTPGRLIVVLGAGGDRDRGKRRAMGAAARRWADDLFVTDDNPRSEDPAAIRAEVVEGTRDVLPWDADHPHAPGSDCRRTLVTSDAGRAAHIARAVELARAAGSGAGNPADNPTGNPADNTVVVLGKGHEKGQEIGGIVHPFDDYEALAAALRGQPYRPEAREGER